MTSPTICLPSWDTARPDLGVGALEVTARLARIGPYLAQRQEAVIDRFGLSRGEVGMLSALRTAGPPHQLSPTHLGRGLMLSSAGVTSRLDRMERRGFVRRLPKPDDRRGVIVELTDSGLEIVDAAVAARTTPAIASSWSGSIRRRSRRSNDCCASSSPGWNRPSSRRREIRYRPAFRYILEYVIPTDHLPADERHRMAAGDDMTRRKLLMATALAALSASIVVPAAAAAPAVRAKVRRRNAPRPRGAPFSDQIALRVSATDPSQLQVDANADGSADETFDIDSFASIVVDAGPRQRLRPARHRQRAIHDRPTHDRRRRAGR